MVASGFPRILVDSVTACEHLGAFPTMTRVGGHEPEVLSGARKTLKPNRFVSVDCSAERKGAETASEYTTLLEEVGLYVTRRHDDRVILLGTRN